MTSLEFAYLLVAIMGIIQLFVMGNQIRLSRADKNQLRRIKKLEAEMEHLRTKIK